MAVVAEMLCRFIISLIVSLFILNMGEKVSDIMKFVIIPFILSIWILMPGIEKWEVVKILVCERCGKRTAFGKFYYTDGVRICKKCYEEGKKGGENGES